MRCSSRIACSVLTEASSMRFRGTALTSSICRRSAAWRAVSARPVLEVRVLVKHYRVGDGEPIRAVDGVTMTVADGEFVAMYVPSGSGKTTLLELIAGTQRPTKGTVLLEGQDICALSERELDEYRLMRLGIIGPAEHLIPGSLAIESASLRLGLHKQRQGKKEI